MSGVKAKFIKDTPGKCPDCGDKTWDVYTDLCRRCAVIRGAVFRQAMNWPPDELTYHMAKLTEDEYWAILGGAPHPRPGP